MRNWLLIAFLFLSGNLVCFADSPAARLLRLKYFTNELNSVRIRLHAERPGLGTNELNQLAETLARSNRLAADTLYSNHLANTIPELLFSPAPDFAHIAAQLNEFVGTVDDLQRFGQPLLYVAVNEDKPAVLDFLLEQKASPDAGTPFNEPVLMQAVQYRRWDMALKLIEAGASVTRTNNQGRSAAAVFFDYWYPGNTSSAPPTNMVPLLLERGLDPFAASRPGNPASILEECLRRESGYRNSSMAGLTFFGDLLLTNNASPARRTPLGDTALHLAVYQLCTNAIEFLLQAGFQIDQTNNAGLTPLQSLVGMGQAAAQLPFNPGIPRSIRGGVNIIPPPPKPRTLSEYLITRGATMDVFSAAGLGLTNELAAMLRTNATLANARDGYGRTPLHYALLNAASYAGFVYFGGRNYGFGGWAGGPWSGPMPGQGFFMRQAGSIQVPAQTNAPPPVIAMLIAAGADPSAATTRLVPQLHNDTPLPAGSTPLHLAARNGNTSVLRLLLISKADAKVADADGNTALHLAVRTWQTNTIPLLLTARASLEATNLASQTPLRAAVESGVSTAVAILLDAGANPTNGLGTTTLMHLAAERGDVGTLTVLLKHKLSLEARDSEGRTPFQKAIAARNWASLNFLRDEGANIHATNFAGDTALHLLAAQQDDTVYHQPDEPALVQWQRKQLATPGWSGRALAWLIQSKVLTPPPAPGWTNTSLTSWLLEHDAKINATNRAGQTPLHSLCSAVWVRWYQTGQSSNRVMTLLNAGASLDLPDTNGLTPLHIAATNQSVQMLKFLLVKAGARVDQADVRGRTMLHRAVETSRDNYERVVLLLDAGANPNFADKEGLTPLHLAAQFKNDGYAWQRRNLVLTLLTHGANPNLTDHAGRTPLDTLLDFRPDGESWYRHETMMTLLTNRADLTIADRDGNTPLHRLFLAYATNYNFTAMRGPMDFLVKQGANLALTNHAGQTPLHIIARPSQPFAHTLEFLKDVVAPTNAAFDVRDTNGDTPLHIWARSMPNCNLCADRFAKILELGNRAAATNFVGETPVTLLLAATNRPWLARALLTQGYSAEALAAPDRDGQPLLHRMLMNLDARYADQQQLLRRIFTNRALVNLTNSAGDTPLHVVLRSRNNWNYSTTRILMEAGADPMLKNARGETPLRLAAIYQPNGPYDVGPPGMRYGFFTSIRMRDQADVNRWLDTDPGLASITNKAGVTPLMAATESRKTNLVLRLLEMGAPLDALSALRLGRLQDFQALLPTVARPLPVKWSFEAVRFNQLEGLQALVAAGADAHSVDDDGHSLLFRARAAGQNEMAGWLTAQDCRETFFDAVVKGDRAQARTFIEADRTCVNATNRNSRAPLIVAVAAGNAEMVALLLESGARPDTLAAERWNALHLAAANDSADIARLLLKVGVPTNALTASQMSPLEIAAAYGATNMVELLIQCGASVNTPPQGGFKNTALHWAVHLGQVEMVRLLLAHGADLNVKNSRNGGETPLELARVSGNGNNMGFGSPPEIRRGYPGHNRSAEERAAVVKLLEEAAAARVKSN